MKSEARDDRESIEEPTSLQQEITSLMASAAERQKTIETLRKSEAYFGSITPNASDPVIESDRTGNITYAHTLKKGGFQWRNSKKKSSSCTKRELLPSPSIIPDRRDYGPIKMPMIIDFAENDMLW